MQHAVLILKYSLIHCQFLLLPKFPSKISISIEIGDCIERNKHWVLKESTARPVFFFPDFEVCEEGVTSC